MELNGIKKPKPKKKIKTQSIELEKNNKPYPKLPNTSQYKTAPPAKNKQFFFPAATSGSIITPRKFYKNIQPVNQNLQKSAYRCT